MSDLEETPTNFTTLSIQDKEDLRLSNLKAYWRSAQENEPHLDKNNKILRYCIMDSCTYNSSVISNFRRHLDRKHQIQVPPLKAVYFEYTADSSSRTIAKQADLDKTSFRDALVRHIVLNRLPFSIVESPSFLNFLQLLNPLVQTVCPTSHNTIRKDILNKWLQEKQFLQIKLRTIQSNINISVDIWTSPNTLLFLGVVAHYIQDGKLCKSLLGLRSIGCHSGEEQWNILRTILEEYDCLEKLGVIIGDNASTNDTLCRTISTYFQEELEMEWNPEQQRIRCMGHIINLIVQSFLFGDMKTLSEEDLFSYDQEDEIGIEIQRTEASSRRDKMRTMGPLGKIHNIVVHIRSSGPRTKEFVDNAGCRIPLDNRTRWNSWYSMLNTAIKVERHIDFYIKSQKDLQKDILTENEWEILRTTSTYLQIFHDMTLELQKDQIDLTECIPSLYVVEFQTKAL
jgi:hypothetical protein